MNQYDPRHLKLELLPEPDPMSGNPAYEFLGDYVWSLDDTDHGPVAVFPKGKDTDGGSIPDFLQSFAQPMSEWGRVPFVRHDLKYTLQGGRRRYASRPEANRDLNRNPISKSRADFELFTDVVCSQFGLIVAWYSARPSAVRAVLFALRLAWILFRSVWIYALVAAFGGKAWDSIEPGTEPVTAP